MELKVETADGSSLPKGCFVSVRVGDVQKQRRYETKGAFQFPAPAHSRKAKIDLYMHVGTASISVGPEDRTGEVNVNALEPGAPQPRLKVVSTLKQEAPQDRENKMSNVKKEAVEYLSKWLIQERLGEAVKALLQKRPEDPIEFICGFLRANAAAEPELKKPVAAAAPAKKAEAVPLLPFLSYYRVNMVPSAATALPGIYAKFPAPKREAPPAKELDMVRDKARVALEKAFFDVPAKAAPPAAAPKGPTPEWLKAGAPPQGFGIYYNAHLQAAMPESPWGSLFSKFNSKAVGPTPIAMPPPQPLVQPTLAPMKAAPPAAAPQAAAAPSFKVAPSVGTWLAPRPRKLALPKGELPAHLKASWDLQGLRPASCMCIDERVEAERIVTNALLELTGELEGEYLPLPTSTSYPARPGGMSEDERLYLRSNGLLLEATDPVGRGVFVNAKKDVAVWVNGKNHVQLIVKQGSMSAQEGTLKLRAVQKALSQALTQEGHDFAGPTASCGKRLKGLRAPGVMSIDERCEVERVCAHAFLELTGDLEGDYYPLPSSMSYPPRPGGMTEAEECDLAGNGLILGSSDATGRGIFMTTKGDLAVVVNGENHMEFITRCPCMTAKAAQARIQNIENCVRDAIRQSGFDFA